MILHDRLNTVINLTHSIACVESGNARALQRVIASPRCGACSAFCGPAVPGRFWRNELRWCSRATLNKRVQSRSTKQQRKSIILSILPVVMPYDRAIARQAGAGTGRICYQKLSQARKSTCTYDMCAPTLAMRVCSVGCRSRMRLPSEIQASMSWVLGEQEGVQHVLALEQDMEGVYNT